jgi:hypothetical protein
MGARKPSLDWIKEVLADPEDCGERAQPAPRALARRPATERPETERPETQSPDLQPMNDRPEGSEGDDRQFCPSWQLMRVTAARKS